jgi:hypothetical protein
MLPPGWAKLATSPLPTGSPAAIMTIGIVEVARLAASGASVPAVMITSTLRLISSAANLGSRSSLSSAYLRSNVRFLPSKYPSARRASTTTGVVGVGEPALRTPIL